MTPEFRAFYRTFWDDPDVHALSHLAYRILTTLKGTLPASGIGHVYQTQLAERCGAPMLSVNRALVELEQPKADGSPGWIVRDRALVWLVNGLRYEYALAAVNPKHRKFIADQIDAIRPKSKLLNDFRAYYPEWFPDPIGMGTDTHSIPIGMGIETHRNGYRNPSGSQETRNKKLETERPTTKATTPARSKTRGHERPESTFNLAPYLDAHRVMFPDSDPPGGRYGKAFKRLEAKHGAAETLRRWQICLRQKGLFATPEELSTHWPVFEVDDPTLGLDPLEARVAALIADEDARLAADEAWLATRRRPLPQNGDEPG